MRHSDQPSEIAQQLQKYDRLLQIIAWLALEEKSAERDAYREVVLVNFQSILNPWAITDAETASDDSYYLVTVADQIWALADSNAESGVDFVTDFTDEIISQILEGAKHDIDRDVSRYVSFHIKCAYQVCICICTDLGF